MVKAIADTVIRGLKAEKLTLKKALTLIALGEEKAHEINIPMVFTVLDEGGNMIAQHRMDDSLLASIQASYAKAYTAVCLRMPTAESAQQTLPGKPLYGLQFSRPDHYCFLGGGIPVMYNHQCIGGLGVSGGTIEQDIMVADYIRKKSFC